MESQNVWVQLKDQVSFEQWTWLLELMDSCWGEALLYRANTSHESAANEWKMQNHFRRMFGFKELTEADLRLLQGR